MKTTVKISSNSNKAFDKFQNNALTTKQTAQVKGGDGLGSEDGVDI